jgi:hypothetical protein
MPWDRRYRQLDAGEVIRPGDEIEDCDDVWRGPATWTPVDDRIIGQQAPDPGLPSHPKFRRKVGDQGWAWFSGVLNVFIHPREDRGGVNVCRTRRRYIVHLGPVTLQLLRPVVAWEEAKGWIR